MADKMTEAELNEYVSTFEETLQRFTGLSSEEIWELQRILLRRVRFKVSETLSPEGKAAMKQVKQDMLEFATKKRVSSATLVTEVFDLGSKQTEDTPRKKEKSDIVLVVADDTEMAADDTNKATDKAADDTNKATDDKAANGTTDSTPVETMVDEETEEDINAKETETETDITDENIKQGKESIDQIANDESRPKDAPTDSVRGGSMSSNQDTQPQLGPEENGGSDKVADRGETSSGVPQTGTGNDVDSPSDVTGSSNVESESHEGQSQGQERKGSQDTNNEQSSQSAEKSETETLTSSPS